MEISKELLIEVMEREIGYFSDYGLIDGYIKFGSLNHFVEGKMLCYGWRTQISIEAFVFKCKKWAFKYNRELYSSSRGHCCISNLNKNNPDNIWDHYAETEVEAIIKACEWILKEINEKQLQH